MKPSRLLLFCCAIFAVTSGQTPAPQASQAPASQASGAATPLRHLEYRLQADYVTNGEEHGSGMSGGGEGGIGSGVNSMLGGGGRRGTIDVDVVGLSPDGALIMSISEMLESAPRRSETFTCTVFGDGHTLCPTATGPLTDAENLMLSLLGRGFIDPNALDAKNHWQRNYAGKEVTVVTDYSLTDPGGGRPVTIAKHSKITSRVRTIGNSVEDGQIVYDLAMSVPDSIHDTVYETQGSGSLESTFDLTLMTDSFAKH